MANSQDYIDFLLDQLSGFRTVRTKRMFGGHGIFAGDLMFALVVNDQLYLKADANLAAVFIDEGCQQFTYQKQGKTAHINYYTAPEETLDDPEMMAQWAERAYQVALRAQA
ncbi:TfoX/Sxy family protein [Neptuniibacter sp. CAU 1671]|uniref:TfoX/Sxy family protein n=1 Tax=Neptuniibacter sp. CAU 1671 TaxID=3032593 RepID=UPI0023DC2FE9|nr:TfoX/Sxy family protein [Neptuniibacter sp. CAU 1671]MDF2182961.1 TfoX/Sxy family protein [Neptuniibacter sp. CAU 1671]